MVEELDSSANEALSDDAGALRRPRGHTTAPALFRGGSVAARPTKNRTGRFLPRLRRTGRTGQPLRSLVSLALVGGLVATVALPAYGAWQPSAEIVTVKHGGPVDVQALPAGSETATVEIARDGYTAVSAAEIERAAKQAAAEAARARAAANAAFAVPVNINLVSPGTGEVRWPILNFTLGRGLGAAGYHQGVDLLAPAMTPIYATAAGVVTVSSESYNSYGVTVSINHVIGGQSVNSLYAHMTVGTRQVQVGQTVAAGQLIGFVGSTGRSTANHVHFEVQINGTLVDPWAWLQANAG